jgi:antitoxin (DNA-binding transcriptional repressor) of toxin-antitoxin stability system
MFACYDKGDVPASVVGVAVVIQVTVEEAAGRLSELVDAVLKGEQVFITVDSGTEQHIQFVVVRETHPSGTPEAGSAKGWFILTDDFDEPLEDFEEYMR